MIGTHEPLKAGDKVYVVYDGGGDLKLHTAIVAKSSAKQITLQSESGRNNTPLGFDCRVNFSPESAKYWGRTPREAFDLYLMRLHAQIGEAQKEIERVQENVRLALEAMRGLDAR